MLWGCRSPKLRKRNERGMARNRFQLEPLESRLALTSDFLLTWAAGLIVGDFSGSRGGIFVSRPDGTDMRQITVSQTNNFQFSGDGLNLPDDHPSFSPDGKQIVFTTSRFQAAGEANNFEIAIMNVDGTHVRRLTQSPGIDTEPVFSPDGTKLAFVSDRSGNLDIWTMNVDGSGLVRLTTSSENENEPAWNHAGTKLAFTRIVFGGVAGVFGARKDVYIMNANGSGQQLIAGLEAEEHDAVWSLDDQKLILTSEKDGTLPFGDVTVVNIQSRQYVSNLTVEDRFLLIGGGGDPTLSPDGSKIAYFKATGGPLLLAGPQKIHVMNANGTNKRKIDAPGIINVHPHFGKLADSDADGKPDYLDINSPSDFNAAMIQDEARVIAFLGDLTTLSGVVDVGRLATRGYVPGHAFDSFQGMGVAFARDINNNDPSVLGVPDVLLYQPDLSGAFGGRDPIDVLPDFNYRLVGWGYATKYNPSSIPTFAGFPEDKWLVHEAGFHPITTGEFLPTVPANDSPRGTQTGNIRPNEMPLTPWHERLWDIHFFRRPNGGTPMATIHDPFGRSLPGNPTGTNAFFYPQLPYRGAPSNGRIIEAEEFDMGQDFGWRDLSPGNSGNAFRVTDVDIAPTREHSEIGHDVVKFQAGEFLQYTVNLESSGFYDLGMRLTNGTPGVTLRVEIDGVNRSGTVTLPITRNSPTESEYISFAPFSGQLSAGKHRIRLVMEAVPPTSRIDREFRLNSLTLRPRTAPTARLDSIPTVAFPADHTDFDVNYTDNAAILAASLGTGDIQVTGPGGFVSTATFIGAHRSSDSPAILATYRVPGRSGGWDSSDNGTYSVSLLANQIQDITGTSIAARTLGSFQVNIAAFQLLDSHFDTLDELIVTGTDRADTILVNQLGTQIHVLQNGVVLGSANPNQLRRIRIGGGGGDDTITMNRVTIPGILEGGGGNDILTGGDRDDSLRGGSGDDHLFGAAGNDSLFGEDGNDTLDGGSGINTLDEGTGSGGVFLAGTGGNDAIVIDRRVTAAGPQLVAWMNGREYAQTYRLGETVIVEARGGHDLVRMTPEAGKAWRAIFRGGDGNDVLIGGALSDRLEGDAGDDALYGGDGDDFLYGGLGNDHLDGESGNDFLSGADGDDRLFGGTGRDVLIGGRNQDFLFGQEGDDILIGDEVEYPSGAAFTQQTLVRLWKAPQSPANRIASLRSFLSRVTVKNDNTLDLLFGGAGHDWFLDFYRKDSLRDFVPTGNTSDRKN
jgi:Tol biopolymer transport system component/Ca2+-binding RTX toxin-like protein